MTTVNPQKSARFERAHPPNPNIEYAADGSSAVGYRPRETARRSTAAGDDDRRRDTVESVTQFQISLCATSLEVAAKLQLGSIYSQSMGVQGKAIFYDAVATTDYYEEAIDPEHGVLYGVRHAIGVRLALNATNITSETNLSYAAVAAQVQVSGASVFYEVQGIGIPHSLLKSWLSATSGPLTESSYAKIDHVLRVELPDYLADTTKPLTTSEYIVVPRTSDDTSLVDSAHLVNFAMTQIARGRSLNQALAKLDGDHDDEAGRFLVTYVYSRRAGISDPASTPSAAAIAQAKEWRNT